MHYNKRTSTTRRYEIQHPDIATNRRWNCYTQQILRRLWSIGSQFRIANPLARGQKSYKVRFSCNKLPVQHCTRRFSVINIEITWYKGTYQFPPDPAPRAVIGVHLTPIIPVAPDRTSRPISFSANRFFPSWLFESKDCWQHCTGPVLHCEWWPGIFVALTLLKKTVPVNMKRIRVEVNLVICIFDISITFLVLDAKARERDDNDNDNDNEGSTEGREVVIHTTNDHWTRGVLLNTSELPSLLPIE